MSPRRILLTGATRGLGRALVERFVEHGHVVLGCGRTEAAIEELRGRHRAPHDFRVVDVADAAQVSRWAEALLELGPPPDLIVNNAALINPSRPLWEIDAATFDGLMAVNVSGTANVLRAFLPAVIARGAGVIANVSSGWGRSTSPEVAPYCASKWAIEGLTQALAQELPRGVSAVAVNPGIIDTEMLRSCFGDSAGTYPDAEEWSHTAARFLLALGQRDAGRSVTIA